jgi:hypothetical protein
METYQKGRYSRRDFFSGISKNKPGVENYFRPYPIILK